MERKHYLELCQKNAVNPDGVNVIYEGHKYYPLSLKIWFNWKGETKNTAEMLDCNSRSKLYCDVKDVSED